MYVNDAYCYVNDGNILAFKFIHLLVCIVVVVRVVNIAVLQLLQSVLQYFLPVLLTTLVDVELGLS